MQNTFWTFIEDGYYRIYDGVLKYAPVSNIDDSIVLDDQDIVQIITPQKLEVVNNELGSSFLISDF